MSFVHYMGCISCGRRYGLSDDSLPKFYMGIRCTADCGLLLFRISCVYLVGISIGIFMAMRITNTVLQTVFEYEMVQ